MRIALHDLHICWCIRLHGYRCGGFLIPDHFTEVPNELMKAYAEGKDQPEVLPKNRSNLWSLRRGDGQSYDCRKDADMNEREPLWIKHFGLLKTTLEQISLTFTNAAPFGIITSSVFNKWRRMTMSMDQHMIQWSNWHFRCKSGFAAIHDAKVWEWTCVYSKIHLGYASLIGAPFFQ